MRTLKIAAILLTIVMAVSGGLAVRYNLLTKVQNIGNNPTEAVFYLFQMLRKDGVLKTIRSVRDKLANDPRLGLGYSLYDRASYPPVEDQSARNALPEHMTIPAADIATLPASREPDLRYDTWYRSNGDERSGRYSSLDQVNAGNVGGLDVAWKYVHAPTSTDAGVRVQSNPIMVNGRLFVASTDSRLLSLDAATGRELWRAELPGPAAIRRGLVWEPNDDFASSRLFVPTARGVFALNAETGEIQRSFGNDGEVGDQLSTIAPVIAGDKLIVAIIKPAIEAYDRRSGKLLWTTPLLEVPDVSGALLTGGSPWSGMSYDAARSRVYVSTGNPRPELWGISRPGPNRHSSSIVAVDTETGRIAWSFQEVSHDLWDLDVPSPPVLTTIVKDGKKIDVVAAVTKIGNTLLLDRDRGQPIFDYRMRRAPASTIPGEQTAPYQPDLELPESFLKQVFELSDVTDLSEASARSVRQKIRTATAGFFVPPALGGSVLLYGLGGGASWFGAAADQRKGILYIPSNQTPWIVRASYRDLRGAERPVAGMPGNVPYQALCARCHGPARDGVQEPDGGLYYPALTGITILRQKAALTSKDVFRERHEGLDVDVEGSGKELSVLFDYFSALDKMADEDEAFAARTFWGPLQDDRGNPGSRPPWGLLTALDLNSGRKIWQVPFGEYANLSRNGKPVQGQMNNAGATVTAGGLLFATGTLDQKIRAYDSTTGRELWSFALTAAGTAPPTTYMLNGQQYVVTVASTVSHQEVVAFKLRSSAANLPVQ